MLGVISPHLDDAVFGCGELIASRPGAVVITVFTGIPPKTCALPEWDAACGFASAQEAMLARRAEDRAALELLGATPCWLDCLDAQYAAARDIASLAHDIEAALRRYRLDTVAMPLGLFHSDHKLVHEAALALLSRSREPIWLAYEEANYRRVAGELDSRLSALRERGLTALPFEANIRERFAARKAAAARCYASQLRGLGTSGRPGTDDLYAAERYWSISP
jgi:LmbE family N-acetylglucosaminyl deacetylase